MNSDILVEIKNIHKSFSRLKVIKDVSFNIPPGEIFGLLGPNGAGKTTIIKMMLGLLKIDEGEIKIGGYSIERDFEKAIANVGGIIENPEMYGFLSGYKNLIHYANMNYGVTRERIDDVIQQVGLEKRIHDKVKQYSLGMKQRLGIAQAILHRPRLLVLDEPTNGLDPAGIKELRDHLRKLADEEGVGVLVSSHLLSEMELMCDRFAIIQKGIFIETKTISEILSTVNLVRFEVDRREDALSIIEKYLNERAFSISEMVINNSHIDVPVMRDESALLLKQLVDAGILVYRMQPMTKSLEDNFLEVTRGKSVE